MLICNFTGMGNSFKSANKGLYLVKVVGKDFVETRKLVIQ